MGSIDASHRFFVTAQCPRWVSRHVASLQLNCKSALVEDIMGVGRQHSLYLLSVGDDLDVRFRGGSALCIPAQHSTFYGTCQTIAGAEHNPVHCQRWILLVVLQ